MGDIPNFHGIRTKMGTQSSWWGYLPFDGDIHHQTSTYQLGISRLCDVDSTTQKQWDTRAATTGTKKTSMVCRLLFVFDILITVISQCLPTGMFYVWDINTG